jgi:catechol 2,3-dioxygenase-like lactoylglutathione lyase family enzyme
MKGVLEMVKEIRHSGIVVTDREKALEFYEALGFRLVAKGGVPGSLTKKLLGIEKRIKYIKMAIPNENTTIEFYIDKELHSKISATKTFNHIALTVTNINEIFNIVKGFDSVAVLWEPILDTQGKNKLFFCRDPFGNLLEFVEPI